MKSHKVSLIAIPTTHLGIILLHRSGRQVAPRAVTRRSQLELFHAAERASQNKLREVDISRFRSNIGW